MAAAGRKPLFIGEASNDEHLRVGYTMDSTATTMIVLLLPFMWLMKLYLLKWTDSITHGTFVRSRR